MELSWVVLVIQKTVTQAPPVTVPPAQPNAGGFFSLQNVTTGIIALAGIFGAGTMVRWAWLSFVRPGVDDFVFESIRRRRAEIETHLRKEVFKADLEERDERVRQINTAVQIAKEAVASVELIRLAHDEINEKLERVMPICESFDRVEQRLERIDARGDISAKALERILGRMDERDRWDGIFRRSTDPPNSR